MRGGGRRESNPATDKTLETTAGLYRYHQRGITAHDGSELAGRHLPPRVLQHPHHPPCITPHHPPSYTNRRTAKSFWKKSAAPPTPRVQQRFLGWWSPPILRCRGGGLGGGENAWVSFTPASLRKQATEPMFLFACSGHIRTALQTRCMPRRTWLVSLTTIAANVLPRSPWTFTSFHHVLPALLCALLLHSFGSRLRALDLLETLRSSQGAGTGAA